jgi:hypothetical protein
VRATFWRRESLICQPLDFLITHNARGESLHPTPALEKRNVTAKFPHFNEFNAWLETPPDDTGKDAMEIFNWFYESLGGK